MGYKMQRGGEGGEGRAKSRGREGGGGERTCRGKRIVH